MSESDSAENDGNKKERDGKGRFARGNSGRPRGARHKTTVAVEKLLQGEAEALTEKAIKSALAGDNVALRLCLERIAPVRKGRVVDLRAFPPVNGIQDVPLAFAEIIKAVAAGKLTPDEAGDLSGILERYSRAIEVSDLEARVTAIEKAARS
ncbi:DUF5681 domain-containing protein [Pelagibacterium montanilacus]|uniref:DUF5681 domain-containing protein n=1 Tax=Pelagibacterium montanilacus TaxID=2185280 RepID=UPI000F8C7165|nr:DUF5681 domain-containing protein [Pelagibacterium montanilacus]